MWLIVDGDGDLAGRASYKDEADEKLAALRAYWGEASECGHPIAQGYAAIRIQGSHVEEATLEEAFERFDGIVGYLDAEP